MREHTAEQIAEFFTGLQGKKILVTTHATPDGDAIGSASATTHLLRGVGAEVKIILLDGCPENLAWLMPMQGRGVAEGNKQSAETVQSTDAKLSVKAELPEKEQAVSEKKALLHLGANPVDGPSSDNGLGSDNGLDDNGGRRLDDTLNDDDKPIPDEVSTFAMLGDWVPDVFVVVDCGDGFRPGGEIAEYLGNKSLPSPLWKETVIVNIDHHLKNPLFGTYNICEPHKAATAEIIGDIARAMQVPLAGDFAEALYVGLVTDTGNFTFSNTTGHVLAMAAEIVNAGLHVAAVTDKLYNNWSIGRMNLWGQLMSEMSLHQNGKIARSVISLALLEKHGAGKDDLEGFAGWMRHLSGVKASLLVREDAPGKVKISVRSMGNVDVRAVAEAFGGGGHKAAAGATLDLPVTEAAAVVLERLVEEVKNTP